MSFYDRAAVRALFDTEEVLDESVGLIRFVRKIDNDHLLMMHVLPAEERVTLTITSQATSVPLVDVGLSGLLKIMADETSLYFYKQEHETHLILVMKPTVSLSFEG